MKPYLQYQKALEKHLKNSLRIEFLTKWKFAEIIPRFLKFRIPTNGCFDDNSVQEFQQKLLRKEIACAKTDVQSNSEQLTAKRVVIQTAVNDALLPSVAVHSRYFIRKVRANLKSTHNKKLAALSEEQERPLFSVKNTVIQCELDNPLPQYIIDTLALGPKSSILDKFNEKDVLAELDGLLSHCKRNQVNNEIITDINVKTLNYIKKCKKQKSTRNITMTKKYLKDNNLLAIPFDKGIGICVMKKKGYSKKLNTILQLPQFEKVTITRRNGLNPILKEEQRI